MNCLSAGSLPKLALHLLGLHAGVHVLIERVLVDRGRIERDGNPCGEDLRFEDLAVG